MDLDLSEIRGIFLAHRKWLESSGAQGRQAELEPFHLYGPPLCGFDFSQARMAACQMPLADLRYALMVGTDLEGAVLTGIEGFQIGLTGANLRGAYLRGAYLVEGIALGTDFERADLREGQMGRCDLRRARFPGADLREADLSESRCQEACFEGADLTEASLAECDLSGANLENAQLLRACLTRCNLTGANLRGAVLEDANLGGAVLTDADLRGANLKGAVYERRTLLTARLDDPVRHKLETDIKR